ncbi:MAG: hypothetical protein PWQ79_1762 [Thermococcaceae archaeon]|nr:hypothetical protein [Thermococcaceae archaeon]
MGCSGGFLSSDKLDDGLTVVVGHSLASHQVGGLRSYPNECPPCITSFLVVQSISTTYSHHISPMLLQTIRVVCWGLTLTNALILSPPFNGYFTPKVRYGKACQEFGMLRLYPNQGPHFASLLQAISSTVEQTSDGLGQAIRVVGLGVFLTNTLIGFIPPLICGRNSL